MESLSALIFILLFGHIIAFTTFNSRRVNKIVKFLEDFRRKGILSDSEYVTLNDRYSNGIFKLFDVFPDEMEFPKIYTEKPFSDFAYKCLMRNRYFIITIPILFMLVLALTPRE